MAVVSLLIIIVCIYLLAIITDEFFIVSLDQISQKLKLPNDVAGASLMAMGSSAPELAIALLALFRGSGEHSDLGIATIVGSAVFNILVITGVSAIARPARITLPVIIRDSIMYGASIGLLLYTFADGTITLFEAFIFLIFYFFYIVILFNWKSFYSEPPEILDEVVAPIEEAHHEEVGGIQAVNHFIAKIIGYLMGDAKKSYVRAFVVSILFIAVISWFLVEYAIVFSNAVGLPPVIVALTILAGGTSIPDMIASIVVAKQGRGQMAVANAVGSNIFDILIGLGVPWIIAMTVLGKEIHVGTGDLWTSTIILAATVILLLVFALTSRTLSRLEGWILLLAYVAYVIWAILTGG
ncbi:MAG: calcium/sodium antiporter [Chloroflexota bacterium]